MTNYIKNSKYARIRLSKLKKWYYGTKEMRSSKYFEYILPFYRELYCCSFYRKKGIFAEGEDILLYVRKCDISVIFRKYLDNLPKYKNWDYWLQDDFLLWGYFSPCEDYLIPYFDAHFERSANNGK